MRTAALIRVLSGAALAVLSAAAVLSAGCAIPHTMTPLAGERQCPAGGPTGLGSESAVTWISPDRNRDEDKLEAWCRTVGPALVDSVPAVTLTPERPGELVVATWNVHGRAGDVESLLDRELGYSCPASGFSSARPVAIEAHFVVLIQEAVRRSLAVPEMEPSGMIPARLGGQPESGDPGTGDHGLANQPDIEELAARCGLAMVYVPSMRNGADSFPDGREDRGNAILSSLPLHDFLAIELPFEAQRRIAVGATVRPADDDSLRLVSLHLDTMSGFLRTLRTGNSNRLRQGLGLVEALHIVERDRGTGGDPDSVAGYSISMVVAGDLNTFSDHQTVIRHLTEHFPDSPPADGRPTKGVFPADHILFRQGTYGTISRVEGSYHRLDDLYYSDHYARMIRFTRRSEGT